MSDKPLYKGCPVQHTLQFLSGKWKIGILWNLRKSALRFGELKKLLPGITEKMLMQELRFFETKMFVKRTVFAEVPPRVEYRLTEEGLSLLPIITEIINWGYANVQNEKVNAKTQNTPLSTIEEFFEYAEAMREDRNQTSL
jgi:DNA-binding HxlR family transcriptional regulator